VALKIRVMASHGPLVKGPVPPLIYRAEAYDQDKAFAERKWACEHEHETAEHAFHCGEDWLAQNPKID
jgi:hypothetical protein